MRNISKVLFTVTALFVVLLFPYRAFAATLYYDARVDTNWATLGNWWSDVGRTVQALALPTSADDVVITTTVNSNTGAPASVHSLVFNSNDSGFYYLDINSSVSNGASFYGNGRQGGILTGDATFYNATHNIGNIYGNVVFNNSSVNRNTIFGNVTFNDLSDNEVLNFDSGTGGYVSGNAVFNNPTIGNAGTVDGSGTFVGDVAQNTGTVSGTKIRRYTASITTVRNFVSGGPWTIIADGAGVVVNVVGATYDGTTTFVETSGGVFQYTNDSTPPVLSLGLPTGELAPNTTSATLSVTTNEASTCKYDTLASVAYASMASTFATTGATLHTQSLTGLTNGTVYTYRVRCRDTATNPTTTDYTITFSVAVPVIPRGGGGGLLIVSQSVATNPTRTSTAGCIGTSLYSVETGARCPNGESPTPTTPTTLVSTSFLRDLTFTMTGEDVKALQVFLNDNGFVVTTTGWGSKGQESIYFGRATEAALKKFQEFYSISPSKGYFGIKTRTFVQNLVK